MAHRGRFVITLISNPDLPADLSFKRESQQSPKTATDKPFSKVLYQGLNHEQESNKQDASPKPTALPPTFSHHVSRTGVRHADSMQVPDSAFQQHETPAFPSPNPHRGRGSTSHASQLEDSSQVPMSVVTLLQESLCGRFTEMMQLHREMMGEVAARDMRRDQQMSLLIEQNVELVRTVMRLRHEQAYLHPRSK